MLIAAIKVHKIQVCCIRSHIWWNLWSQGAVRSSWSLISAGSPWYLPRWNLKLAPIYWKPGETKKEAGHSRLGGGGFKKPGKLRTGLGWPRWVNLHINHDTLNVYMEASPGFSHVSRPNHLSNTLRCQGCILEHSSHCENGGQSIHPSTGQGESPTACRQLRGSPSNRIPMSPSNNYLSFSKHFWSFFPFYPGLSNW